MSSIDGKEIGISLVRSVLSAVPFAGQFLNEMAFECRGRIKQNRLNQFTELLGDYFSKEQAIDFDNLKTEDFSDLLESVLRRVVQTKSIEKHKRFRDILVNQIEKPTSSLDNAETYLDLISTHSEQEIQVLKHHQPFDENFEQQREEVRKAKTDLVKKQEEIERQYDLQKKGYANDTPKVLQEIHELNDFVKQKKEYINSFNPYRSHEFYQLSANEFLYYKQMLYSKGLLIDSCIGGIEMRPFEEMAITEFGKKFIEFIMKDEIQNNSDGEWDNL